MFGLFALAVLAVAGSAALPGNASLGMLTGDMRFNMADAKKLARLAQISYCPPNSPDVLQWSCPSCVESDVKVVPGSVRFLHGDSTWNDQAVVGKLAIQRGCFVAFRGSHNLDNWVKDFQIWYRHGTLENYPHCEGCHVHTGFYTVWQGMRDKIHAALDDIGCKYENQDPVYITGHSLGGALAHLAAFTLQDRGFKIGSMYSFESPRVGNDKFAARFNAILGAEAPCYRITNDHDPAVHCPPRITGFTHVNTEVYFSAADSSFKICDKTEDPDCSNQHDNLPWDLAFDWKEHCGLLGFGNGFDICSPVCGISKIEGVTVSETVTV